MPVTFLASSHAAGLAFGVSVAVFAAGEFQQVLRVRRRGARASIGDEVLFRAIFFGGVLMLPIGVRLVPEADIEGPLVFLIGLVVGWLGIVLRWWSFVTLGRYFTTVVKASADQPIIAKGPYRALRHPGYTGLIMVFTGCGLVLGNGASTVSSVVLVSAALVYRLLREERALVEASGTAYLRYAKGRPRLIPFVW